MARVTVEDCLQNIDNRFTLVMAASQRTKNLLAGSKALINTRRDKPHVLALREIAAKKITLKKSKGKSKSK